ncbi:MAG: hypothetical protein IKS05_07635 [Oscillospiraceae bacterium]|nr:hypothetical protein [Oscillospiraceae bacterium]
MPRMTACMLILGLLCCLLWGCEGAAENPAISPTEAAPAGTSALPEASAEDSPTAEPGKAADPYPPEAYEYHLGTAVDFDPADSQQGWLSALGEDQICQVVYRFDPAVDNLLHPLRVWAYPDFPAFAGDEEAPVPQPFRGRYLLELDASAPLGDIPELFCSLEDPAVFGLVEAELLPLAFTSPAPRDYDILQALRLRVTDLTEGSNSEYTVLRDGTVILGDAAAEAKLPEAVTDYLFALRCAWNSQALLAQSDGRITLLDPNGADPGLALRLSTGARAVCLTRERRDSFAACFTQEGVPNSYRALARWGCGPGSHGAKLLEIDLGPYEPEEGLRAVSWSWTLWEDGQLSLRRRPSLLPSLGFDHPMTCDSLLGDQYFVSVHPFDTEIILSWLE